MTLLVGRLLFTLEWCDPGAVEIYQAERTRRFHQHISVLQIAVGETGRLESSHQFAPFGCQVGQALLVILLDQIVRGSARSVLRAADQRLRV